MKTIFIVLAGVVLSSLPFPVRGGELTFVPIPATKSDVGSGISPEVNYTAVVDTGLEDPNGRRINGVTFVPTPGHGNTIEAGGVKVRASAGELILKPSSVDTIKADGALKQMLSDSIYNSGAKEGSTEDVVLDAKSLEAGSTYDLRLYFCNGGNSSNERDVNLTFFGDGKAPVKTGVFNADDARSSPGKFKDRDQVYYINYRFTWDGKTVPGVRVTMNRGSQAFALYGVTNQLVQAANTQQKSSQSTQQKSTKSSDIGTAKKGAKHQSNASPHPDQ